MDRLKQKLRDQAVKLGFARLGVTTPTPPEHWPVFEQWLEAGRHGNMAYLASDSSRQRRADPRAILPECRSILVLALPYFKPELEAAPEGEWRGRVAAYAWGDDYHDLLPPRLEALVAFLEAEVGHPISHRVYTDTGPILERDLAQRAGLGWIGKNTCLIHPAQGSYFLLAEVLLDLELEPDVPFTADHCGNCTRCLEACPTACILPNRTLDARRCISYLTIENKGSISPVLRPLLTDWTFGCDLCQQVCPWNGRFSLSEGEPAFAPRPGLAQPNLITDLQTLTPQVFNQRFKGSPVQRAKRRGYLRNAAVTLGNRAARTRSPDAVAALQHCLLADPEPLVRAHAAWALGQVGGKEARQALERAAAQEGEVLVLAEIQAALQKLPV